MPRMIQIDIDKLLSDNQEARQKLRDQCDQLIAKVTTEDREMTKDEEGHLTEWQDKIVNLKRRGDQLRKQIEISEDEDTPNPSKTKRGMRPGEDRGRGGGGGLPPSSLDDDEDDDEERKAQDKQYRKAFGMYLRHGMNSMPKEMRNILQQRYTTLPSDDAQVRAMSAIAGAEGGFTVPEGFIADVEVAMKDFSGVRKSRATLLPTTTGNDLPWPTVDDTNNEGEQVEENEEQTEGDPKLGQINFRAFLFSSRLIRVPIQLIQDTGVNLEALLARLMAERLGRITNRRFTTGNGANQPMGIVTASKLGKSAAASGAIAYADLVDLEHSVDPAYRGQAEFMMHDNTVAVLKKLLDLDGRPIWMPAMNAGIAGGAPGLLLGYRYDSNQHMAQVGAGNRSVVFGDMSKYHIRDVRGMVVVRLTERYAERLQVGFFAFLRTDGRIVDAGTGPIKHLVHP